MSKVKKEDLAEVITVKSINSFKMERLANSSLII